MPATSLDRQLDDFAAHLDALASRATRTAAELRRACHTALEDLDDCTQHLDFARVDAELAHMDARDELHALEGRFEASMARVLRRIENARDESIAALLRLQDGVDAAAGDVARRASFPYRTPR